MTLDDLKKVVQTGDALLLRGGPSFISKAIEFATHGDYCHVGLFEWVNGTLMVNEMYNDYREVTIEQRLADTDCDVCWGRAPEVIYLQPDMVKIAMDAFRADTEDHDYGYETLLKVWAADRFGEKNDPDEVQPVCSVYCQRVWDEVLGGESDHLFSPVDVARYCQVVRRIEK